jgi:Tol biopolymer transport system component
MAAALGATLLVAGAGAYLWFGRKEPERFRNIDVRRLTTTGKAAYAAVSPDGRYVAYALVESGQYSLWMRHVASGSNVEIVPPSGKSYDYGLVFSRDGSFVYYLRPEGRTYSALYEIPVLGGVPKKLIYDVDSAPAFSPDGKRVAFMRCTPEGRCTILTANLNGAGEEKLAATDPPGHPVGAPSWSSDGKTIAVGLLVPRGVNAILSVPAVGGPVKTIALPGLTPASVAWLSGGKGLILSARDQTVQLWHVSYPSGQLRKITKDANSYRGVSLTADDSALATVQFEWVADLWVLPFGEPEKAAQIVSGGASGLGGICWAPDGSLIYASRASGNRNLWIAPPDGRSPRQLTRGVAEVTPRVSPDGRVVAFSSRGPNGNHLWRMDVDGGNLRQLTQGKNEYWPAWSPDGKWLVYASGEWPSPSLWRIPSDGGDPVRVVDGVANYPAISPDGKWIAYLDQPAVQDHVRIAPFEGGVPGRVSDVVTTFPVRWTRDGRSLIFFSAKDLYSNLWLQPVAGGPPRQLTRFKGDLIVSFDLSQDGGRIAVARGRENSDVVMIRDLPDDAR